MTEKSETGFLRAASTAWEKLAGAALAVLLLVLSFLGVWNWNTSVSALDGAKAACAACEKEAATNEQKHATERERWDTVLRAIADMKDSQEKSRSELRYDLAQLRAEIKRP